MPNLLFTSFPEAQYSVRAMKPQIVAILLVTAILIGIAVLHDAKLQTKTEQPKPAAQSVSSAAPDSTLVAPDTVRVEKVTFVGSVKNLTVSDAKGRYMLACNSGLDTCLTPAPSKDYFLFNKTTKWKFPGATGYVTLDWLQDWSIKYTNLENIALVPDEGARTAIGMYWLVSWSKNEAKPDPLGIRPGSTHPCTGTNPNDPCNIR